MSNPEIYSEFEFFDKNPSFFNRVIKKVKAKIQEIKKKKSSIKQKSLTGKKKLPTPK